MLFPYILGICTLSTSEFLPYSCQDLRLDLVLLGVVLGVDAFELDPVDPGVAGPATVKVVAVD